MSEQTSIKILQINLQYVMSMKQQKLLQQTIRTAKASFECSTRYNRKYFKGYHLTDELVGKVSAYFKTNRICGYNTVFKISKAIVTMM